ncbi:HD-GYP domain-containing protein [Candidatus Omnitrophota bacterium]
MEDPYIHIPAETLLNKSRLSFDVFIKASENRMILYCARNKVVSEEACDKLFSKQLHEKLYIFKKDKSYYDLYLESILNNILLDSNLRIHEKSEIAYDAIHRAAVSLFESPKAEKIQRYKKVILDTMEFVIKNNESLQNLISLTSFQTSIFSHCINVGIYSMGITIELLKIKPTLNYQEMVPGFFLHDIGKCGVPLEILNKKGPLTNIEWKFIKRHPMEGCNLLKKQKELTRETEIIISQHHERFNGNGYPKGLSGGKIHLYAKICALADVFDALTSHRPYRQQYSSFVALKIMKDELQKSYDPKLFNLFVKLFGKTTDIVQ